MSSINYKYDVIRGICKELGFSSSSIIVFGDTEEFKGHCFYIKETCLITIMFKTIITPKCKATGEIITLPHVCFKNERIFFKDLNNLRETLKKLKN